MRPERLEPHVDGHDEAHDGQDDGEQAKLAQALGQLAGAAPRDPCHALKLVQSIHFRKKDRALPLPGTKFIGSI